MGVDFENLYGRNTVEYTDLQVDMSTPFPQTQQSLYSYMALLDDGRLLIK